MKILTGKDIRGADAATMRREPISSLDLMERASEEIARIICEKIDGALPLLFVVGKGNNAGDGLAVARILSNAGFDCAVTFLYPPDDMSEEARENLFRLPDTVRKVDIQDIETIDPDFIVVDAILGTGLEGVANGGALEAINVLNNLPNEIISIDVPSGMQSEFGNDPEKIVRADRTITIGFPKLAMFLPESGALCGEIDIADICLDEDFISDSTTQYYYTLEEDIRPLLHRRSKFDNKGTYGHALLVCGSEQMPGAALLAAGGALRSGCGLVTVHTTPTTTISLISNYPSAVLSREPSDFFSQVPADMGKYRAVGVGCGLGTNEPTKNALADLLSELTVPAVIDADALNLIARNPEMKMLIPAGSVLTPHPKEFLRLVGQWNGEQDKLDRLKKLSSEINSIVVLKGANTAICRPDGRIYFNSTGNPGMAKGGSGDVLTGLITGLLTRGYDSLQAALIGVFIHGLAGDKTADYYGEESMNGQDLIEFIAEAFGQIY